MDFYNIPPNVFVLNDEEVAKLILLELGILRKIPDPCKFSLNLMFVRYNLHITHWLLILRFNGFSNPEENGHSIIGWPKAKYSSEQVHSEMVKHLSKIGVSSVSNIAAISADNTN